MRVVASLIVVGGVAAFGPQAERRSRVALRSAPGEVDAEAQARAQRRQAIMAASERAAARMTAMNDGKTMERPGVSTAPAAPPVTGQASPQAVPPPPSPRGLAEEGKAAPAVTPKFNPEKPPEGYRPYYNTGEGYLSDLTQDSTIRHFSTSETGTTQSYDPSQNGQLGVRPKALRDEDGKKRRFDDDVEPPELEWSVYPDASRKKGIAEAVKPGAWAAAAAKRQAALKGGASPAPTLKAPAAPAASPAPEAFKPKPPPTPPPAPVAPPTPPVAVPAARAAPPTPAPAAKPLAPFAAPMPAAPQPVKKPVAPPIAAAAPKTTAALSEKDRITLAKSMTGLVQHVQQVQSGEGGVRGPARTSLVSELTKTRAILIEESLAAAPARPTAAAPRTPPPPAAPRAPPRPPQTPLYAPPRAATAAAALAPDVAPASGNVPAQRIMPALSSLDAAAIADIVQSISPAFAKYGPKFADLACDGAFLASLGLAELEETLSDIGVTSRLEQRRILHELGLLHKK